MRRNEADDMTEHMKKLDRNQQEFIREGSYGSCSWENKCSHIVKQLTRIHCQRYCNFANYFKRTVI